MYISDCMYDYRYQEDYCNYICKDCNETITEEEYLESGYCRYCNTEKRCLECFSSLNIYEEEKYDGLCEKCYNNI